MIFRAWDEPCRFTDVDAGITAADVAGENLSVTVWPERDAAGCRWNWELWEEGPTEDDSFALDGGICDTEAEAEAAGEKAKDEYRRSLTGM